MGRWISVWTAVCCSTFKTEFQTQRFVDRGDKCIKISSWKTKREIGHLGFLGMYGDDIKLENQEVKHDDVRWLQMAQDSNQWLCCAHGTEHSNAKYAGNLLTR